MQWEITSRVASRAGRRLVLVGTYVCQFLAEPTGRREEKMPRAAGGIADTDGEQRLFRLAGASCQTVADNGIKGRVIAS